MRNIFIKKLNCKPIEEQEIEIVERKGLGHPDSIADGIAESVSRALCKMYIEKFGTILHHNTDQVEVVGGHAYPKFGGGEMVTPIYILLSGRATMQITTEKGIIKLPVGTVAIKAAKEYLKKVVRNLDVDKDVIVDCRIGQGSVDLVDVFERQKDKIPLANDTSFGVGYAPLSTTERLVLETEKLLNSEETKKEIPALGEDIKVMGLREGKKIKLTIAAAIVDKYVKYIEEYKEVIKKIEEKVKYLAKKIANGYDVKIYINTADDYERGAVYITVTGTSAEMGYDGSVGRGNRVNGLITPFRPMSMEAASGKNPVNHVGKIYNILANLIANDIANLDGVKECYVRILSQIGKPINEPKALDIELIVDEDKDFEEIKKKAEEIANNWLNNILKVRDMIVNGEVNTF